MAVRTVSWKRNPPPRAHAQAGATGRPRVQREDEVEGELDAQRPGDPQPLVGGSGVVDLEEAVEPPPLGPEYAHARVDGEHREREPAGRADAQDATTQQIARARERRAGHFGVGERSVEEEAAQDEEDRYADREVGNGTAPHQLSLTTALNSVTWVTSTPSAANARRESISGKRG